MVKAEKTYALGCLLQPRGQTCSEPVLELRLLRKETPLSRQINEGIRSAGV